MPGVDDGARDLDESRIGLSTLEEHGVSTIITTPHLAASTTARKKEFESFLAHTDAAFASLKTVAAEEFPELVLERGVEMMLDVVSPDLEDPRVRLAGSEFVLFEFPFMRIPPNSTHPIDVISNTGKRPIIAHPERYGNMSASLELVDEWRKAGASIQVNAGSLVGRYGATAQRIAWLILEGGQADYLSSDYHSRGRCSILPCAAELSARGGGVQLHALTVTNPQRILESKAPEPVTPLEPVQTTFWKRVFARGATA
jgi:protein-tyrosine phosphatase